MSPARPLAGLSLVAPFSGPRLPRGMDLAVSTVTVCSTPCHPRISRVPAIGLRLGTSTEAMISPSRTVAAPASSVGSSEYPVGAVPTRWAVVIESAVAVMKPDSGAGAPAVPE